MSHYELYGWRSMPLKQGADLLAAATGLTFNPHDSEYCGEYYRSAGWDRERITIQNNVLQDEDGSFLMESEFPDFKTLVYVNERDEWGPDMTIDVEGLELLRTDTVD